MIAYVGAVILLSYLAKIIFGRMMRKPVPVKVQEVKPDRRYKVARGGRRK